MKLIDLIDTYDANGFVIQDAGNGSRTSNGVFVFVDDCGEYLDTEMKCLQDDHISDDNICCTYTSSWVYEGEGSNPYRVRILF